MPYSKSLLLLQRPEWPVVVITLLLIASACLYLPGISGPWIFDDYPNILNNDFLKIERLDFRSLWQASFSLDAGPLQRPLAMFSFALNYYFAGGLTDTTPFKIVNVVIHVVNGFLVWWLAALILGRARQHWPADAAASGGTTSSNTLLAGIAALIWATHPIQLTSVLYVAQRMTELSALFTVAGLAMYLYGRRRLSYSRPGLAFVVCGILGGTILGLLSKETAILLPIYVVTLEYCLFSREKPWLRFTMLSIGWRRTILAGIFLIIAASVSWVVLKYLPGYQIRKFDLVQRLLTESRVVFFYLSLILLPQIDRFGHQHDDIEISTSLLLPWTTVPSLLGLVALFALARRMRRRTPLLSLGVLWFLAGHTLESSFLPLEIAHEHRNYLPTLGVVLAAADVAVRFIRASKLRWTGFAVTIVALASVTVLRSLQWSDYNSFFRYEAAHHPKSARIQTGLGILLAGQGQMEAAMQALRTAADLDPEEPGHLIVLQMIRAWNRQALDDAAHLQILRQVRIRPPSAATEQALFRVNLCIKTTCAVLQRALEEWVQEILNTIPESGDSSYYLYMYGRVLGAQGKITRAIEKLELAYQIDPKYLHPLFELAAIYISQWRLSEAQAVLTELRQANQRTGNLRNRDIQLVERDVDTLRKLVTTKRTPAIK